MTLRAALTDAFGNPVPSATVSFVAPSTGPTGQFGGASHASAVTDAAGLAIAPPLTANSKLGRYTIVASIGALRRNIAVTNVRLSMTRQ